MAGIYLHIPFCKQACHYCDFHFSTSLQTKNDLLKSLEKEMELQRDFFGFGDQGKSAELTTIYFGGGTPSLLTGVEIKRLLNVINDYFSVRWDAEITLEANPDDLSREQLLALRDAGINRLSIGIQSFDDADLKWMNRAHNTSQALESVKLAQSAGFNNITIDLIYGTPLLTDAQWKKNLHTAFDLNVQHLSCYALTVEPRTALASFIEKGNQPQVDDSKQATHFGMLMDLAEKNGFEQYEISNFARNGQYSRHNSSYWLGEKYLGIGPSAHSFNGESRQWNSRNNHEYIKITGEGKVPAVKETLTRENRFNEYVMTSLRTMWGCDPEKIKNEFGKERAETFLKQAMQFANEGLMVSQNEKFVLTKKGKYFADRIASEFFVL